jgi:hypothetical protein
MKKNDGMTCYLSLAFLSFLMMHLAHADPITINNNYAPSTPSPAPQAAQAPAPTCNANQASQSYGTGMPPGTYTIKHSDGTSNTVYTTGDKQPYIVDNSNCNSPPIQPYVYVNPPFVGSGAMPGPVPTPGPFPGPSPRR